MTEIFISLVMVFLVCGFLYWLGDRKVPAPFGTALRVIAVAAGVLWLLFNVREIIRAIVSL